MEFYHFRIMNLAQNPARIFYNSLAVRHSSIREFFLGMGEICSFYSLPGIPTHPHSLSFFTQTSGKNSDSPL